MGIGFEACPGMILPAFCGPLGILFPLRIRAKICCAVRAGRLSMTTLNRVLGTSFRSLEEFLTATSVPEVRKLLRGIGSTG